MGKLLIWVLFTFCLICCSLEFKPVDNYLIDCGSSMNTSVGNLVFMADGSNATFLSTPQKLFVNSTSKPDSSTIGLALYQTARILNGNSNYTFPIKKRGGHFVRLHFFPFVHEKYNLSSARFSVYAQNFTLLRDFQPESVPVVKEYSLNITADNLVLSFAPSKDSFAFLNALEVMSIPDELIPESAKTFDPPGQHNNLWRQALETVARVNMGNQMVSPQNDTLSRLWVSDYSYLRHGNLVKFVEDIGAVNYTGWPTKDIAPPLVYGTITRLDSQGDPNTLANITWLFEVDPGFQYFVRFHFCDIVSPGPEMMFFNVYINSLLAVRDLDLSNQTLNVLRSPYFMDFVTSSSNIGELNVSIGPSSAYAYPDGILNGLEILKISNSRGSLDFKDSELQSSTSRSKRKVGILAVLIIGVSFLVVVLALILFVVWRKRSKLAHANHSAQDHMASNGEQGTIYSDWNAKSNIGYRFPLAAVREATENFSDALVIGADGFGKVYKGVLRDKTKIAVKRGQSQQGFSEFETEIEMLSQFRHRHLVSLFGYCDEQNEMIIIYEYLDNGTLKNHLYGSDLPKLSWRQRLEICIGSAKGLHYLHTGSTKAIIHRDVKSANILLDENLMAKVADFGLSKNGPEIDHTHVNTAVKGSFGYLDPEYLIRQQLTDKSDVYSFGVVMLEILSGRPVIDPSQPREMVNLVEWALKWLKAGELEKLVDPHISEEIKPESLREFGETATKCLAERGVDRPRMGEILWKLECAFQLQGISIRPRPNSQLSNNHFENSISTTQYSVGGSVADLAGISMSKVFSEMVKTEMR